MASNSLYDIRQLPDTTPSIKNVPVVLQHVIFCVKDLSHYFMSVNKDGVKINGSSNLSVSKSSTGIYTLSYCFDTIPTIIISPVISSQDVLIIVGIYGKTTSSAIIQTLLYPASSLEFRDSAFDVLVKIE